MKNDSTSFFENNHFANSYVFDISISHVPAYFGLHWHHYIEIVLAPVSYTHLTLPTNREV